MVKCFEIFTGDMELSNGKGAQTGTAEEAIKARRRVVTGSALALGQV